MNTFRVGISEYFVSNSPNRIITMGLGSCIGISVYSKSTKIGGLSHILLPDSTGFNSIDKPEKFADLAIPMMISEIIKKSKRDDLVAKIVGGSSMFASKFNTMNGIGNRNIDSVINILEKCKVPIIASHVGGTKSRTMILDLETFDVLITIESKETIII